MSALTIGLATAGTLIGVGLVYYGIKGNADTGSAATATATATGTGAGTGYSPYVPTTYDNLGGPRQQVYGGRGRGRGKSKRTGLNTNKRTKRSKRSN